MTRRRRRLLIPIIISSRASTSHIVFAPTLLKIVSCPCHCRSSAIPSTFATPSSNQKFHIIELLFLFFSLGSCSFALCISCTTRLVAYVLFVPIPRTLPWIFTLFIPGVWTSLSRSFFSFCEVVSVTSAGNNAIPLPGNSCLFGFVSQQVQLDRILSYLAI